MSATEAQVAANRANSLKSTGPKTLEGKERSRANSYQHGLTGAGVVMAAEEAAEVERLSKAFEVELKAEGEVGHALARRMAVMSVRMDRCIAHEQAALTDRVRRTLDEFEAPEGASDEEAAQLRDEASGLALFDPSKPATLARQYEAAAERCFLRCLKELRQRGRESARDAVADVAAQARSAMKGLASFSPPKSTPPPAPSTPVSPPARGPATFLDPASPGHFDVPIAIGRAR